MGLPNMKNQAFDPVLVTMAVCQVTSVVSDFLRPHGLQPARLLCPWDSPGKNPGVGCHVLLQGIFPTQGLSLGFIALALAAGFFTISTTWEAPWVGNIILKQETLAHGFPGSGMQDGWLGGSASGSLISVIGRFERVEAPLPQWLTWLVTWCWLLARGLSPCPPGPFHRPAWVSPWPGTGSLPSPNYPSHEDGSFQPSEIWPQKSFINTFAFCVLHRPSFLSIRGDLTRVGPWEVKSWRTTRKTGFPNPISKF